MSEKTISENRRQRALRAHCVPVGSRRRYRSGGHVRCRAHCVPVGSRRRYRSGGNVRFAHIVPLSAPTVAVAPAAPSAKPQ